MLIHRYLADYIRSIEDQYQVITITGPRQSGKTTLCRHLKPDLPYVNLEDPDVRQYAVEDPKQFLAQYPHGAILDEIQRASKLPSYLQVIVDASDAKVQFLLSGSQSFAIKDTLSQSLAGRTAVLELLPLSISELIQSKMGQTIDSFLYKGGFPRIYLDILPSLFTSWR